MVRYYAYLYSGELQRSAQFIKMSIAEEEVSSKQFETIL